MAYLSYFGFTKKPFSNTPDPNFFFNAPTHQEALSSLLHGISGRKGFLVLTGEVGTGKTTMCRTLLATLQGDVETALVLNPDLSETEILCAIVRDFGIDIQTVSKTQLMDSLYIHLVRRTQAGGNSLIIIDDAQNLPLHSLEQIRMISNFETNTEKLIQILLIGQPELKDKLQTMDFRQVRQRVSIHRHLVPLTAEETRGYIRHRLAQAGAAPDTFFFTTQACRRIFQETGGYPRLINTICDQALDAVFRQQRRLVDADTIREQARNLRLRPPPGARLARHRRSIGAGLAASCAAALVAAFFLSGPRLAAKGPGAGVIAPELQGKLAAVEESVAVLQQRITELQLSPALTDSLARQSEELEKKLTVTRGESDRLRALLRQKEAELRAFQDGDAGGRPQAPTQQEGASGSKEAAFHASEREAELKAAVDHLQGESQNRLEQIRHLEKVLQTLKARLTEAEDLREKMSRNLREKEELLASLGPAKEAWPALDNLRAENEQLRRSQKLIESLSGQTIRAQGQEIDRLKQENEQLLRNQKGTTSSLPAPGPPLTVAVQ